MVNTSLANAWGEEGDFLAELLLPAVFFVAAFLGAVFFAGNLVIFFPSARISGGVSLHQSPLCDEAVEFLGDDLGSPCP